MYEHNRLLEAADAERAEDGGARAIRRQRGTREARMKNSRRRGVGWRVGVGVVTPPSILPPIVLLNNAFVALHPTYIVRFHAFNVGGVYAPSPGGGGKFYGGSLDRGVESVTHYSAVSSESAGRDIGENLRR
eukprot:765503-Hanusia_phi.AAC.7